MQASELASRLSWWVLLGAVFALGAYLRFANLGEPSLWYDEILHWEKTTAAASEPPGAWLGGLETDDENGPLFYATQLLARRLASGDTAVRLMPALAGTLTVPVMTCVGNAVGGPSTALVATALTAMAPLNVYFSREGRPYSGLMLLASLFLLLLVRRRQASLPGALGLSLAGAYTAATAGPLLLSFAILSATRALKSRHSQRSGKEAEGLCSPASAARRYLFAACLGLVLVAWLYVVRSPRLTPGSTEARDLVTTSPLSLTALERLLASLTVSGVEWAEINILTYVTLVLAAGGIRALWRRSRAQALDTVGMFALPLVISFTMLVAIGRWYGIRYTCTALPGLLLLTSTGIVWLAEAATFRLRKLTRLSRTEHLTMATALGLTLVLALPNALRARTEPLQKTDWRGLARLLETWAVDGEAVIAANWWPARCLRYYLRGGARSLALLDVDSSSPQAELAVAGTDTAWLVAAGYVRADEIRTWMRSFDPIVQSRLGELEVHFYPDLATFLRTRFAAQQGQRLTDLLTESQGRIEFDGSELLLLGAGWSFSESSPAAPSYQWATGLVAEVGLPLAEPVAARLHLRVLPFTYDAAPPLSVELRLNSHPVGEVTLQPGWQELQLSVPVEFVRPGANLLRFEFSRAVSPASLTTGSSDSRPLAVAFDFLLLEPVALVTAPSSATP